MATTLKLTPNDNNGSGVLPEGYNDIEFSLSDGNWCHDIHLPEDGKKITIINNATWSTHVDGLEITTNNRATFVYQPAINKWNVWNFDVFDGQTGNQLMPAFQKCSSVFVSVTNEYAGNEIVFTNDTPEFTDIYVQKTSKTYSFMTIYVDKDSYVLHPAQAPYDLNNTLHLRQKIDTHKWSRVIPDGSINAPWPWHNGRNAMKGEYFIILPSDATMNPALNPGDIWQARVDYAPYYPENGADSPQWANLNQREIKDIEKVRLTLKDGDCIYSNGKNSVEVDMTYVGVDMNGKLLTNDQTASLIQSITLIDYNTGQDLSGGWEQHNDNPGYVVPFSRDNGSTLLTSDIPETKDNYCFNNVWLTHNYYLAGNKQLQLGCKFVLKTGKVITFSINDKALASAPWIKSIPPRAFAGEELHMTCETIYYRKKHHKYDTYNSAYLNTWTAPAGFVVTMSGNDRIWHYYQTGHEDGGKQNTWWMCAGSLFLKPGVYPDGFYGETGGPYNSSEDLYMNVDVAANTFKTSCYLGEGYSWINGLSYPQATSGYKFSITDQYGTRYNITAGSCHQGQSTPIISCELCDS